MPRTISVHLELSVDGENSMAFEDTFSGLEHPWYEVTTDEHGNVDLWANAEGFEHLARLFLKYARCGKAPGFHCHFTPTLKGDWEFPVEGPEFTVGITDAPGDEDEGA